MGWQFHNLSLSDSELAHTSLSPSIHGSIVYDSKRVERSSRDVRHIQDTILVVEELDELRRCGNLDSLRETELAFEATTPSVEISLVSHNHRVAITTCDHCNALISQRFQNLRLLSSPGAAMTSHALVTRTHAEHVAIARQVERVVLTTGDGQEPAHVLVLLRARQ